MKDAVKSILKGKFEGKELKNMALLLRLVENELIRIIREHFYKEVQLIIEEIYNQKNTSSEQTKIEDLLLVADKSLNAVYEKAISDHDEKIMMGMLSLIEHFNSVTKGPSKLWNEEAK